MPVPKKIIKFLEKNKIKYEIIQHKTVYTALDKTATLKVSPKIVGKSILIKLDKKPALVLIPADKNLDTKKIKKIVKTKNIDFIKESWMKKKFKRNKNWSYPPLSEIYGKCKLLSIKNCFYNLKLL